MTRQPATDKGPDEKSAARGGADVDATAGESRVGGPRPLPPLSLKVRVALTVVGVFLLLVGLAGLALPGLQGLLTIVAGLAILSVVSERVHRWLHRLLHPWPGLRQRLVGLRERMHGWLNRHRGSRESDPE